jgi:hypothetical protein
MYINYVRFANPLTQLDNTARNPLGAVYSPPWGSYPNSAVFSTTASNSTKGYGAPPVFKYVYFYDASSLTGTAQIAPAPVYYIDESFTTVTPNAADAFFTTGGACIAGYWMPNTTSLGTSQTAAQWYAQFIGSYGWIQLGGFLPGALAPTTLTSAGQGSAITGAATGSWTSVVTTTPPASSRILGVQWTAIAAGVCDVLVGGDSAFWGS